MKLKHYLVLFFLSLWSTSLVASSIDGVNFSDEIIADGKPLLLNGLGTRKATFLKVKVYHAALYLAHRASEPEAFLETPEPKQIVMSFVRNVGANDLKKTYSEAFATANPDTHQSMATLFNEFNSNFQQEVKKGQKMIFTFTDHGTSIKVGDQPETKFYGDAKFSQSLLRMWFIRPQDPDLARGLLRK